MAGEDATPPFPAQAERQDERLWQVERELRHCLNTLDACGLSHAAAHVDLALHQLHRDFDELRSCGPGAGSSGGG